MREPPSREPERGRSDALPRLSARERQALHLLADGRSTAQIAAAMSISPNTVRARIHHLRAKLDVRDRQHLVPRARDLGLLPSSPPGSGGSDDLPEIPATGTEDLYRTSRSWTR
jgi:DNA-binding CsgD family transcriptional regulator